jgi:predicted dinucleotide-binding enzyme
MSIGIIGAGNLGSHFARALARKNIPALAAA